MPEVKVKVKTRAREDKIVTSNGELVVFVRALPEHGKANQVVRKLMARHLGVTLSQIRLKSGGRSTEKIFVYET